MLFASQELDKAKKVYSEILVDLAKMGIETEQGEHHANQK
jgi:hypothetical protein